MKKLLVLACFLTFKACVAQHQENMSGDGKTLQFWGRDTRELRQTPVWKVNADGSVKLEEGLDEQDQELARKTVVNMLAALYEKDMLPFKTKNYARTKGVLDRVPLERFMDVAEQHLASGDELEHCLEWGPFFTRWPNVTQPYMKRFKCKSRWVFHHDARSPRVRSWVRPAVYGELDRSLEQQHLTDIKNKFDLVIIPQTLQYVVDPHLSVQVLYDMLKPGGYLIFSTPFMQTIMPYPTDYYRFTAEGNELLLKAAGFEVVKSFVGGDDFWSICWIMHCGVQDLSEAMLSKALRESGKDYSHNSYMLSVQLARKPAASNTNG